MASQSNHKETDQPKKRGYWIKFLTMALSTLGIVAIYGVTVLALFGSSLTNSDNKIQAGNYLAKVDAVTELSGNDIMVRGETSLFATSSNGVRSCNDTFVISGDIAQGKAPFYIKISNLKAGSSSGANSSLAFKYILDIAELSGNGSIAVEKVSGTTAGTQLKNDTLNPGESDIYKLTYQPGASPANASSANSADAAPNSAESKPADASQAAVSQPEATPAANGDPAAGVTLRIQLRTAYTGKEIVTASTADEIKTAQKGATVYLLKDIEGTDLTLSNTVNFNLNGYTLKLNSLTIKSAEPATVDIENGTLSIGGKMISDNNQISGSGIKIDDTVKLNLWQMKKEAGK
ncbi:hypothetical protein [Candidatus Soleaferrea massiliensis]|uniref:hypothetical protein n=1 Tax=Candidatus Soleaferrea massiliensis TaxID=1470354 RepID=UPI00058F8E3D|nr:hypothetical protein [Candidatus Soleaferrea massiliensis]